MKQRTHRRFLAALLSLALTLTLLGGCRSSDPPEPESSGSPASAEESPADAGLEEEPARSGERTPVRLVALNGPTGMGLVGLMDAAERDETVNDYTVTLASSPDEVSPKVITGEADIAAVPANLASVLYNKTEGEVTLLALNTLGVLYVVTKGETVESVADLAGKTIYATGQGATPEYTLNHILTENGLSDTPVEFKSEHAELATLLLAGDAPVAMLPEPFVTNVVGRDDEVVIALDLTKEWEKVTGGAMLPTGAVLVRNEFLQAHPEAVRVFLEEYRASTEFVNSEPEAAGELIGSYGIAAAEVAQQAIPRCNIVFVTGEEMKTAVETYYGILLQANPQSVGGALPDEDFYYPG